MSKHGGRTGLRTETSHAEGSTSESRNLAIQDFHQQVQHLNSVKGKSEEENRAVLVYVDE